MTEQEAMERIKSILYEATADENAVCYVTDYDEDALKIAIKSLEKQIPKKVKRKDIREYARFYCPNNHYIFEEHCKFFDSNKHDFSKIGYCECCGQKLDWSEVEE